MHKNLHHRRALPHYYTSKNVDCTVGKSMERTSMRTYLDRAIFTKLTADQRVLVRTVSSETFAGCRSNLVRRRERCRICFVFVDEPLNFTTRRAQSASALPIFPRSQSEVESSTFCGKKIGTYSTSKNLPIHESTTINISFVPAEHYHRP